MAATETLALVVTRQGFREADAGLKQIGKTGDNVARTFGGPKGVGGALNNAGKAANTASGGLTKAGASMARVGTATKGALVPMRGMNQAIVALGGGLLLRKVITSFAQFETGLIGVGKTTGIAGDQL